MAVKIYKNLIDSLCNKLRENNARLKKNQYINFEYLLIKDFNDGGDDAEALAGLVKPFGIPQTT